MTDAEYRELIAAEMAPEHWQRGRARAIQQQRDQLARDLWRERARVREEMRPIEESRPIATGAPRCVTGAEADIEANYPGGLAAFRRDEPRDRSSYHKPDCG